MIETNNLELKKWESTDDVGAFFDALNENFDALDTALGAKPSTLTTTAKTLVGAINEVDGDPDVLKLRPWTENTDANTLGTGIYQIVQQTNWKTFNYPLTYGVLVSFFTDDFVFQIFGRAGGAQFFMRSGTNSSNWIPWVSLTGTTI